MSEKQDRAAGLAVFLKLAAVAGLIGGVLRALFVAPVTALPPADVEIAYLAVDCLLVLALSGMAAGIREFRTSLGLLGYAGAVVGLLIVRSAGRVGDETAVYQLGSEVVALSLAVAGVALMRRKGLARYAGLSWIVSLGLGGAAGLLTQPALLLAAAIFFCVGMILASLDLWGQAEA